ncbi:condensation domain-containing protein [Lysobacter silvisoli]|uniref:Condensation protein n=1 Tax=Lysobacter silvisoli TaxID=2293254 RepID=A0A371JZU3_9GAMM|nr:condensation domain-containing protein [Lysobacter silvisoli]RDZ27164.1 condensation protein [Lysobacter silvisoli]
MSRQALALTAPQYGMWAAQQLDPDSPSLWTAEAVELRGELDTDALLRAIATALGACDALHMRYREEDGRVAQRLDPRREVPVQRLDFSLGAQGRLLAYGWMQQDLQARADLAAGPLFATALIRLGPGLHLWYLRAHHVALDGYAYLLLIKRVAQLYSAQCAGVAAPEPRDWSLQPVVAEDAAYRDSPQRERDRAFWRERVAAAAAPVTLAPPRPPAPSARSCRQRLPLADYARWQVAARACGVDWVAWLLAGIAAWMHRASGAGEVTLGLLAMNRLGSKALAVPCMGMNVVPLRIAVEPQASFAELAAAVAAELRALRPHLRYNYEDLRHDAGIAGTHAQLYGPVVNLMPFDRAFGFAGLVSRAHPVSVGSVEDLDITVSPLADGIRFDIEANPDAYAAPRLRALHAGLLQVVEAAMADPTQAVAELPVDAAMEAA